MTKKVTVSALHKPDESGQVTQVVVRIDSIYPEAATEEATKRAVEGLLEAVTSLCEALPDVVED